MAQTLELEDIQGVVARGYGTLPAARYVLLEVIRPSAATSWLGTVAGQLTTGRDRPAQRAVNLAFTAAGMAKLGLPAAAVGAFADELVSGMTTPHRRRQLGDVGSSAPETWLWGGPTTPTVDALLLLFAADQTQLESLDASLTGNLESEGSGVGVIARLETSDLGGVEHFGFRDGISQPPMEGLAHAGGPDTVRAGEFVLGYLNEYDRYAARPRLAVTADPGGILPRDPEGSGAADLGKNGTYLVFRQLAQDVLGFWRFVDGAAGPGAGRSNGANGAREAGDPAARTWLAAKMVGRWPSGAPLTLAPTADDPALADANDFAYYHADPYGFGCPIGAHVRRANPRDSLDPNPGTEQSLAVNKRHRLLRRGREYGPRLVLDQALNPVDPGEAQTERGLHFICLNANIARQFEFVQSTWLNNPKFHELYDDADPLLSAHRRPGGTFTVQATPVRRRVTDLPQFVTVRGGAYFFLPGIRAVHYLASLAHQPAG